MSPPKPELAVNFDVVMEKNLEQLKMLNAAIFPIKYQVRGAPCCYSRLPSAVLPAFVPSAIGYYDDSIVEYDGSTATGLLNTPAALPPLPRRHVAAASPPLQDQFYKDCMACGDVTQFGEPAVAAESTQERGNPGGRAP